MLLTDAKKLYVGNQVGSKAYVKGTQVWPLGPPTVTIVGHYITTSTGYRMTIPISSVEPNEVYMIFLAAGSQQKLTLNTALSTYGVSFIQSVTIPELPNDHLVWIYTGATADGNLVIDTTLANATYYFIRVRFNRSYASIGSYGSAVDTTKAFYRFTATHPYTFALWTFAYSGVATNGGAYIGNAAVSMLIHNWAQQISVYAGTFSGTGTSPLIQRVNTSAQPEIEVWFNFN